MKELGKAEIDRAGFYSVEPDDRGGVWTRLAPLPFDPSREVEARRVLVENALRLSERFPSGTTETTGEP